MNLAHACHSPSPLRALQTPNVFIVDSDSSSLESLGLQIQCAGWQARMAVSAEEFLAGPRVKAPGCLLVDLHLSGLSALDLQRLISDRTELPVIFMSSCVDVKAIVQAMKAGAFEFLAKPCDKDVMLKTIANAVERSHAALRHQSQTHSLQQCYELLSRREREVMSLVVSGKLNKQVGAELGISEITVKAHRGKVMRKMQAGSLAQLVRMIAGLGLESPNSDPLFSSFASPGRA